MKWVQDVQAVQAVQYVWNHWNFWNNWNHEPLVGTGLLDAIGEAYSLDAIS